MAKIDRIIGTMEKGKQICISVYYLSGRIVKYFNPFTIPEPVKHFIHNAYIYTLESGERLYKAEHD